MRRIDSALTRLLSWAVLLVVKQQLHNEKQRRYALECSFWLDTGAALLSVGKSKYASFDEQRNQQQLAPVPTVLFIASLAKQREEQCVTVCGCCWPLAVHQHRRHFSRLLRERHDPEVYLCSQSRRTEILASGFCTECSLQPRMREIGNTFEQIWRVPRL